MREEDETGARLLNTVGVSVVTEEEDGTAIQLRSVLRTSRPALPASLPLKRMGPHQSSLPPDPFRQASPDPDSPLPPPPRGEEEDTDDEVLHFLSKAAAVKTVSWVKPSKSQVLYYLSAASAFRLKRVGADLQVTDREDFPLLDVWVDMDCCRCTWVVEAYGRVVLLLHEVPAKPRLCCPSARRPITVTDWNGDVFGFLVPGDPFLLQNPERETVARLVPHSPATSSSGVSSTADLREGGPGLEMGELGGAAEAMLPDKRLCWLAVLEGSGRHVARLEDFDAVLFNKDVAFQLKLLTLAGIVRLSGPWMLPGRGEGRHAMGGLSRAVSTFLNCCAYCFY